MEKDKKEKVEEEPKHFIPVAENVTEVDVIEQMRKELDELKKDRDMLLEVADKTHLAGYYQRHQANLPKIVKLRSINGKIILGWRSTQDEVYQDPVTMRWTENQKIELLYSTGEREELHYLDFVRKYVPVQATVVSSVIDSASGNTAFKVRVDSGEEYTIDVRFVN
jgi:hypothetical protein